MSSANAPARIKQLRVMLLTVLVAVHQTERHKWINSHTYKIYKKVSNKTHAFERKGWPHECAKCISASSPSMSSLWLLPPSPPPPSRACDKNSRFIVGIDCALIASVCRWFACVEVSLCCILLFFVVGAVACASKCAWCSRWTVVRVQKSRERYLITVVTEHQDAVWFSYSKFNVDTFHIYFVYVHTHCTHNAVSHITIPNGCTT